MSETGCTPSRQTEVREQLVSMGNVITGLSETVDSLYSRLETATRTQSNPKSCEKEDQVSLVSLANEIRDLNTRIRNEVDRLKDLRGRIEL